MQDKEESKVVQIKSLDELSDEFGFPVIRKFVKENDYTTVFDMEEEFIEVA